MFCVSNKNIKKDKEMKNDPFKRIFKGIYYITDIMNLYLVMRKDNINLKNKKSANADFLSY